MSESNKIDIMCFEKYYNDEPDTIEFSIRYDRKPYLHDKKIIGYLTLEHLDDITIPITQLSWLIETLQKIRKEL